MLDADGFRPMTSTSASSERPVTVIVHLSGRYRGKIQRLTEERLRIGTGEGAEIRFSAEDLTPGLTEFPEDGPYAVLERRGDSYELRAALEADIWVNGRRTEQRRLRSGDVLEIGEGGPVLRLRQYPPGSRAYKSVTEVFSDCAACARHGRSAADRAGLLLAGPPMGLLTLTSPLVRVLTAALLVVLVAAVGLIWRRSQSLERELQAGTQEVRGLAALVERGGWAPLSEEEVDALRDTLSANAARIAALESRAEARGRVISASSRSVAFLQGSWGLEGAGGRPLRHAQAGPDGDSLFGPGGPRVTLEGDGPPVEIFYTGTAFVIDAEGHLLTNRHVALPWFQDAPLELFEKQGLSPVLWRFVGYLPGVEEPFDVELVRASDHLDVALLRCEPPAGEVHPVELAESPPRRGDEVIVMGYPAGIQALLARADPENVRAIMEDESLDFWSLARRLAADGLIEPLATVGIVGQVTTSSVVYDAETTHGGSGGPVLNLDGRVLRLLREPDEDR
jgi:S1-C subfamily serine protease